MRMSSILVFSVLITIATPAMAYIDPGSGSAIMSAVIGFFVAVGLAVKTYWYKIKSFFSGKKGDEAAKTDKSSDQDK